ncbi:MAG: DNA starvation/stationary phase protection protein Dps [Salinigranum sp.]
MSQLPQYGPAQQSSQAQQPMSGTPTRGNLYPTQHYLSEQVRVPIIEMLNQCLADTTDLMTQAKFCHWNVKGIEFFQLHELFDEIAQILEDHADQIAERATALGGQAMGTARTSAANSQIPEPPSNVVEGRQIVEVFADRLARHDANLYEDINRATEYGDVDTADLLNEISREVTKQLYFLESHLQTQPLAGSAGTQVGTGGAVGLQASTAQISAGQSLVDQQSAGQGLVDQQFR